MTKIVVSFPGHDVAEANGFAEELREAIRSEAPDADVQRQKDNPEHQDFGATLGIVLAGPAVVAIARGFQHWLSTQNAATVEIRLPGGQIIARNVNAGNVVDIIKAAKA